MLQMACNGRGADGDHCCYLGGEICGFLVDEGGVPRCSLFDEWGSLNLNPEWRAAPVGRFFTERYPGFDCGDWPQSIPEVMAAEPTAGPFYACCWGRGNRGDLG